MIQCLHLYLKKIISQHTLLEHGQNGYWYCVEKDTVQGGKKLLPDYTMGGQLEINTYQQL